jgi:hypothetical protein
MLYMLLMLPLGILYFSVAATLASVALGFIASPLALLPGVELNVWMFGIDVPEQAPWLLPLVALVGVLLLFATLHLARGVGRLHGRFAKHLLVKSAQYS